uniref:Uncharacterized protein n=1 Tax=Timema shepardi TaxID=629360 RepID=A0A7R9AL55_TIMSH|nr:unnamed protein product [Timema shepardi]
MLESGKSFRKDPPRYTRLGSNFNLPVIGNLVYYESDALDHVATKATASYYPFGLYALTLMCNGRVIVNRTTVEVWHSPHSQEVLSEVKEGFGNQINLFRDRGLNPSRQHRSLTPTPRPPGNKKILVAEGGGRGLAVLTHWMDPAKKVAKQLKADRDLNHDPHVIDSLAYYEIDPSGDMLQEADNERGYFTDSHGLRRHSRNRATMLGETGVRILVGCYEDEFSKFLTTLPRTLSVNVGNTEPSAVGYHHFFGDWTKEKNANEDPEIFQACSRMFRIFLEKMLRPIVKSSPYLLTHIERLARVDLGWMEDWFAKRWQGVHRTKHFN